MFLGVNSLNVRSSTAGGVQHYFWIMNNLNVVITGFSLNLRQELRTKKYLKPCIGMTKIYLGK